MHRATKFGPMIRLQCPLLKGQVRTCKLQQMNTMLTAACTIAAQAGREADIFADAIRARDDRNQQVLCDKERQAARSEQQLRRSEQQLADRAAAIQRLQVRCATEASRHCMGKVSVRPGSGSLAGTLFLSHWVQGAGDIFTNVH